MTFIQRVRGVNVHVMSKFQLSNFSRKDSERGGVMTSVTPGCRRPTAVWASLPVREPARAPELTVGVEVRAGGRGRPAFPGRSRAAAAREVFTSRSGWWRGLR